MSGSLKEAMSEISLDDVNVEADGRVTISNPEVAKRISNLKPGETGLKPGETDELRSTNTRCTVTNKGCS